eukprot:CAMPEP_0185593486 /NCGR_PEP_ID=MMETSP0434-20130131/71664_1 /TAXON_ID=626734 ORGANISM="Favella taraikaensis, Strain Fe Narragansett Bay" /NCGR_SAMPLE_ID=MMETSP0434 /ASSEMBLY_ACC=CAM_ASM_000379 /LENGTH=158 /DNA_ID=CAMNT_0028220103 /DNA_START=2342 /DNA_END=2819 /DNA_ORIENTATION=-
MRLIFSRSLAKAAYSRISSFDMEVMTPPPFAAAFDPGRAVICEDGYSGSTATELTGGLPSLDFLPESIISSLALLGPRRLRDLPTLARLAGFSLAFRECSGSPLAFMSQVPPHADARRGRSLSEARCGGWLACVAMGSGLSSHLLRWASGAVHPPGRL